MLFLLMQLHAKVSHAALCCNLTSCWKVHVCVQCYMFTALADVHRVLHAVACFTTDDTSITNVQLSLDASAAGFCWNDPFVECASLIAGTSQRVLAS